MRIGSILLAMAWLALDSFAAGDMGPRGRVTHEETGEPVADAFVVMEWTRYGSDAVGSRTSCLKMDITKTDSEGWFTTPSGGLLLGKPDQVYAYKPGLTEVMPLKSHNVVDVQRYRTAKQMRRFDGSSKQRRDELSDYRSLLLCVGDDYHQFLQKVEPLYLAIDEEVRRLNIPRETGGPPYRPLSESLEWMKDRKGRTVAK